MTRSTRNPRLRFHEYGDSGVLVDVMAPTYSERWEAAQALADSLITDPPSGFMDVVGSFEHLFVSFDPLVTNVAGITQSFDHRLQTRSSRRKRCFSIPVVYGGGSGPDLDQVADELGMSTEGLIRLHCSSPWVVRFCGSPVGAPLMDGPDIPGPVARCRHPRTRVPSGSVALSGKQCVIYPVASPGGWRLIGRTPLTLLDLDNETLVAYRPGDLIRFTPIQESDWEALAGHALEQTDGSAHASHASHASSTARRDRC